METLYSDNPELVEREAHDGKTKAETEDEAWLREEMGEDYVSSEENEELIDKLKKDGHIDKFETIPQELIDLDFMGDR